MSGIAGTFHLPVPKPVDPARLRAMIDAIAHRGPDGSDVWTAPGIGLAHCHSAGFEGRAQPRLGPHGKLALSFDGNIHNLKALGAELETLGHAVDRDGSAADLILAAWRQWGPGCLSRLDGSFALALFDADAQTLFLARDRLGVKPLHYAGLSDGSLAFASELKGLIAHPLFRRGPDPRAIEDYLALGYVPDDSCLLAGVRKLGAGQCLLLRRGRAMPEPVSWWDIEFNRKSRRSSDQLAHDLIGHLRQAVRADMPAGAALGAFLEPGLAAPATLAFMAEASRKAVQTVSVDGENADEEEIRIIAFAVQRFAARHRSAAASAADLDAVDLFDEPFADPSALLTCRAALRLRQAASVALSSEGGDQLFAGHDRYRRHALHAWLRNLLPQRLQQIGPSAEEAYARAVSVTPHGQRRRLYSPALRAALQGHRAEDRFVFTLRSAPAADPVARAQYADLKIALPADRLARLDRIGTAVGLDIRAPLLDHRLVAFAAGLAPRMRIRRGRGNWLLRQALDGILPDEILDHRSARPLPPIDAWLRGPLADRAEALAYSPAFTALGWFDTAAIARLVTVHRSGRVDHGRLLWQLLMLDRSLQRLFAIGGSSSGYRASAKYSPSGGALKPKAALSRA